MDTSLPDTPRQGKVSRGKPPKGAQGRLTRAGSSSDCGLSTSAVTASSSFLYSPRLWQAAGQQHREVDCDHSIFFPGVLRAPVHKAVPAELPEEPANPQPSKRAKVANAAAALLNRNNRSSRDGSAESSTPPSTPVRNGRQPHQPRRRYMPQPQDDTSATLEERRNSHAGASASNSSQGGRRRSSDDGCHSADSDVMPWPFVVPNKGLRSARMRTAKTPLQPRILAGLHIPDHQEDGSDDGGDDGGAATGGDADMRVPVQQAVAALRQAPLQSACEPVLQDAPVQQQLAQLMDLLAASNPSMPHLLQPMVAQQQAALKQQQQQQQQLPFAQQALGASPAPQPQAQATLPDPAAQLALDAVAALVAQSVQTNAVAPNAALAPASSVVAPTLGAVVQAVAGVAEAVHDSTAIASPMDISTDSAQVPTPPASTAAAGEQADERMLDLGPFSAAAANARLPTHQQPSELQQQSEQQHKQQQAQQAPKPNPIIVETSLDSDQTCHRGDSPPRGAPAARATHGGGGAARAETMQSLGLLSWPSGDSNMSSEGDSEAHDGSHSSHGDAAQHGGCMLSNQEQSMRDDGKLAARLSVNSGGRVDGSGCHVVLAVGSASGSPSSPLLSNDVF